MTATATSEAKPDNLLGICAAIGDDLGIDPMWLRVALGAGILWNPAAVIAIYLAMGVVVLATRWAFPDHKAEASRHPAPALPPVNNANEDDSSLAMAA